MVILNEKLKGIMKTTKSLEDSGALIKGVTETILNQIKEINNYY